MNYEVRLKSSAKKRLDKLPAKDRERILQRVVALGTTPRPPGATKLTGSNAWRVRQGDYRILYTIEDEILMVEVIRIGHRRDIYRDI